MPEGTSPPMITSSNPYISVGLDLLVRLRQRVLLLPGLPCLGALLLRLPGAALLSAALVRGGGACLPSPLHLQAGKDACVTGTETKGLPGTESSRT